MTIFRLHVGMTWNTCSFIRLWMRTIPSPQRAFWGCWDTCCLERAWIFCWLLPQPLGSSSPLHASLLSEWNEAALCCVHPIGTKPFSQLIFLCVGWMSFRSTLAGKDVSLKKKVGRVPVRSEWLVFDLLFLWLLLFSSQVCLSSGPALWHLLPHAVPRGADLRLWGDNNKDIIDLILIDGAW